jgi:hypothetical protein
MILKNLTVGKGLQAYRLFSQSPATAPLNHDAPSLASNEVHRLFYERLMTESDKFAQSAANNGATHDPPQ